MKLTCASKTAILLEALSKVMLSNDQKLVNLLEYKRKHGLMTWWFPISQPLSSIVFDKAEKPCFRLMTKAEKLGYKYGI